MAVQPFLSSSPSDLYRRWRTQEESASGSSPTGLRLAVVFWLLLAAAVGVRTLVRPNSHTVFPIFAASADHWWGDQSLYHSYDPLDNFRYPPVFALFVTPFSVLGLSAGGILWSWTGMATYFAGLWRFVRDVIPSAWTRRRMAVFLILGGIGGLRGLWNGQSNALILGLLLLGAAAVVRAVESDNPTDAGRRWWQVATLLAAVVSLKLTPLAPVLLLCALWPRRLVCRLAVALTVFFLLPFLTRPGAVVLEHYREWIAHLLETGNGRWLGFRDGWTIWMVLRHLLGGEAGPLPLREPMDSVWYRLMQLASAAAVFAWCLRQRRNAATAGLDARWLMTVTLSMGLAWLMLFGPAVEHATYVFLAPSLAWALLERRSWPHGQGLILAAFTLIMILGWGALTRLLSGWPILLTTLPTGTILFALWLIGFAHHSRNAKSSMHSPKLNSAASSGRELSPTTASSIPSIL